MQMDLYRDTPDLIPVPISTAPRWPGLTDWEHHRLAVEHPRGLEILYPDILGGKPSEFALRMYGKPGAV